MNTLTLTATELCELTGYKRAKEQRTWLKANGFKFKANRLGKPQVDRDHYRAKMGVTLGAHMEAGDSEPDWSALSAV